jgi:hypothetical protein
MKPSWRMSASAHDRKPGPGAIRVPGLFFPKEAVLNKKHMNLIPERSRPPSKSYENIQLQRVIPISIGIKTYEKQRNQEFRQP